jgi:hypothetical protein
VQLILSLLSLLVMIPGWLCSMTCSVQLIQQQTQVLVQAAPMVAPMGTEPLPEKEL